MENKQEKSPDLKHRFLKVAPMPMAVLLKRGQENEIADRLNVQRFSESELMSMSQGTMAFRHMVYENYCVDQCFSYE